MSATNPSSRIVRYLLCGALALLLLGGALTAGRAGAGESPLLPRVVSRGGKPTTETLRRMVAREERYRAPAYARGLRGVSVPPAPAPPRGAQTSGRGAGDPSPPG